MMTRSSAPPNGHPTYMDNTPIQARPRGSRVVRWIIILAIGIPVVVAVVMGATCAYVGIVGPDTKVLTGRQIPARFVQQIRDLGVIADDERIEFFYSDALINIEEGFYLLTDRKAVVYSRTWDERAILVPFGDIVSVEADLSDTWLEDGIITMELKDETLVSFPVSMEGGGDRRMFKALERKLSSVAEKDANTTE